MKLALIDPSLFTIPYDCMLTAALRRAGAEVTLYGRRLRPHETMLRDVVAQPLFYGLAEAMAPRLPGGLVKAVKGIEHGLGLLRLADILRHAPVDVLHFQWAPLPVLDQLLVPALRRLAPAVLTVHDPKLFNDNPSSRLQLIGARRVLDRFDRLIVHSEAAQRVLLAAGLSASRVTVIPHGILPLPEAGAASITSDERRIVLFGKLKPYKGADILLEAFAMLPAGLRATSRLVIIGEPQMPIEPLRARASTLGIADRIDWDLRYIAETEIAAILGSADMLVLPYREIDTSGVLMAAMPYGKPVIASALGAFCDMIADGVSGRLVPAGNASALAQAMTGVLSDPAGAARMGAALAARSLALPSWDDIAVRTLALYAGLQAGGLVYARRSVAVQGSALNPPKA